MLNGGEKKNMGKQEEKTSNLKIYFLGIGAYISFTHGRFFTS